MKDTIELCHRPAGYDLAALRETISSSFQIYLICLFAKNFQTENRAYKFEWLRDTAAASLESTYKTQHILEVLSSKCAKHRYHSALFRAKTHIYMYMGLVNSS